MNFLQESTEEQSLNLTPLIDVVFILLIFFMVSTTFERQTYLNINLPQTDERPTEIIARPHELVIDDNGFFYLKGRKVINNQAKTLLNGLRRMRWLDKQHPITIRADARAPHQSVVTALEVLARMGYTRISITTTPRPGRHG